MTMTTIESQAALEERLDALSAQVAFLVEEAERQRDRSDRFAELSQDLAPLARQAMDSAARELEEIDVSLEDIVRLLRTLLSALPALDAAIRQLEALGELGQDVAPLSTLAMGALTERLQEMEAKGYFAFARSSAGIVDRIVTTYSEDDVEALGDNIVLILDTVKEMTQPEVMTMLRRTFTTVQDEELAHAATPPGLLTLVRQMREPDVRRGLNKVIHMLRSVGEEPSAEPIGRKE